MMTAMTEIREIDRGEMACVGGGFCTATDSTNPLGPIYHPGLYYQPPPPDGTRYP
jgi:hypothetical protein